MRIFLKIFIPLFLLIVIAIVGAWFEYQRFVATPMNITNDGYVYTVKSGSNLQQISRDIHQIGLTHFPAEFLYIYGRVKGKASSIKAGEYLIKPATTLPQLLDQFIAGQVIQYQFTIIAGTTAQQLIDSVIADKRIKKTLVNNHLDQLMVQINEPKLNGEGEFLPETYNFTTGTTDVELLTRAHKLMTSTLQQAWKEKADDLPYKTPYEALIMASIIEKETGIAEERPQIAGVFVRRLQKGMRLQTDPTVIYGLGKSYDGNIHRKDLRTDTPYNTYTRYGLPPTPIALPSKEAIKAALHPQVGKSFYFVATPIEGRHRFSNTLAAHNQAVRKYQLKK